MSVVQASPLNTVSSSPTQVVGVIHSSKEMVDSSDLVAKRMCVSSGFGLSILVGKSCDKAATTIGTLQTVRDIKAWIVLSNGENVGISALTSINAEIRAGHSKSARIMAD